MKRVIAILFVLLLVFTFAACGSGSSKDRYEYMLKEKLEQDVWMYCIFHYQDVKTTNIENMTISKSSSVSAGNDITTYTAKGKVSVIDAYGDKYLGKFTAVYEVWNNDNNLRKVRLDIETPKRQ